MDSWVVEVMERLVEATAATTEAARAVRVKV
jgi:hypothetical protein